jgi:hypothetical protein
MEQRFTFDQAADLYNRIFTSPRAQASGRRARRLGASLTNATSLAHHPTR